MNTIAYAMTLKDGTTHSFQVDLTRPTARHPSNNSWTKLEYQQCPHCPLKPSDTESCPAALDIEAIAQEFRDVPSCERIDVTVETPNRTYTKNCDIQEALRSLFGLIMASGSCPILARLKPLAHTHLPFSTLPETVLRVVGTYLLQQEIAYRDGTTVPDWDLTGIETLYAELQILNKHFMNRLRNASAADANGNAIYSLWSMSSLVELGIDEMLKEVSPMLAMDSRSVAITAAS